VGNSLISYLGWNPASKSLYFEVEGDKKREGFFEIDSAGSVRKTAMPLDVLKQLVQQTSSGDFLVTYSASTKIDFEDVNGKVKKTTSFPIQRNGWHYELSGDDQLLAFQTIRNEIWILDLKTRKEEQVPVEKIDELREHLTLIGWTAL
jgi:hypothetical protein